MTEREKVIKALECCDNDDCDNCPYFRSCDEDDLGTCRATLHRDAHSLLKAQEPKKRESKAMLPCKCGCKRREHWFGGDDPEKFEMLKCSHCGFTAYGKNATDVIRNWNKAVSEDA